MTEAEDRMERFKAVKLKRAGGVKKSKIRADFKESFYEEANKLDVEVNAEFQLALDSIVLGENLFITGSAGVGKSLFVQLLRNTYKGNMVVCGSTGIASANIRGVTLHSFFALPLKGISKATEFNTVAYKADKRNGDVIRNMDLLIIDEVSMVKSYHLETVDKVMRNLRDDPFTPFGGCTVILMGDIGQLPPVVQSNSYEPEFLEENYGGNPFFFSCSAYRTGNFHFIQFTKIYRQKNKELQEVLNRFRDYSFTKEDIEYINQRVVSEEEYFIEGDFVFLASTNKVVDRVNATWLSALDGETVVYEARLEGTPIKSTIPDRIELKEGCQIMMLRNDPNRKFFNGSLGFFVRKIDDNTLVVSIDGREQIVERYEEKTISYEFDKETNSVQEKVTGERLQFPLKLSFSLSIHKSQGLTLDRIYIDLGRGAFASGQTYVALSRARTLEGIGLARPITKKDFIKNDHLINFLENTMEEV